MAEEHTKFKLHNIWCDKLDVIIPIIEFLVDDALDALRVIQTSGGLYKSEYYSQVVRMCVVNPGYLLFDLSRKKQHYDKTQSIVMQEIAEHCIEVNRIYEPDNVIILANGFLDVMPAEGLVDGCVKLVENFFWDREPQLSNPVAEALGIVGPDLSYKIINAQTPLLFIDFICRKYNKRDVLYYIINDPKVVDEKSFREKVVKECTDDLDAIFEHNADKVKEYKREAIINDMYASVLYHNPFFNATKEELKNLFELKKKFSQNQKKKASTKVGQESTDVVPKQTIKFKDVPLDKISKLEAQLKYDVRGQDEACESLLKSIKRRYVGLKTSTSPIGVFLFVGKTGVGKTYLARKIAENLIEEAPALVRVDCNEYSLPHETIKLLGAPPSYLGYDEKEGSHFSKQVREYPFNVILFDELEKANSKLHNLLLQIFDEARLTDSAGNEINFSDSIIICTSNTGTKDAIDEAKKKLLGFVSSTKKNSSASIIMAAVEKNYPPEFLNRFSEIVVFNDLTSSNYKEIAIIELDTLNRNLQDKRNISFTYSAGLLKYILQHGDVSEYGCRQIKRNIANFVENPIADFLIENGFRQKSLYIKLGKNQKVVVRKDLGV